MARGRNQIVFRRSAPSSTWGRSAGLTDGELLDRFEAGRGEVAELAFAVLVERHGPMVLRACRRILRDEHAAQDAFQATFLVLARKGGTAPPPRHARPLAPRRRLPRRRVCPVGRAARRRRHEQAGREPARTTSARAAARRPRAGDPRGDRPAARSAIARPIVLCCLEGITREQAALRLGWRVGTVQSRLARGRERLRDRLARRGIAPAVGTVAAALAAEAEAAMAAVPGRLVEATVRCGMGFSAGHAAAGTVPAGVATLITGVFQAMFLQKLKAVAAASAAVALVGVGISWGQQPDAATSGGPGSRREARSDERLDELERKLDRLIERAREARRPTPIGRRPSRPAIADRAARAAAAR